MVGENPGFIKEPQGAFQEMRILSVYQKRNTTQKKALRTELSILFDFIGGCLEPE